MTGNDSKNFLNQKPHLQTYGYEKIFSCILTLIFLLATASHAMNNRNNQNPASNPGQLIVQAPAIISSNKVLLFGAGLHADQTRVYDPGNDIPTLKNPARKPNKRQYHKMASIGGDYVLLSGGSQNAAASISNDARFYDLSDDALLLKKPFKETFGKAVSCNGIHRH